MHFRSGQSVKLVNGKARRPLALLCTIALGVSALTLFSAAGVVPRLAGAAAPVGQRGVVGERADDGTIQVAGGEVRAITQVGNKVVLGGTFTSVGPARRGSAGVVTLLNGAGDFGASIPDVDGAVFASLPDGTGGWWLAGNFERVGGVSRTNLAHVLADGSVDTAINAIVSASRPHSFLGINGEGKTAVIRTRGNRYGHLVLRGGGDRPNYDTVSVAMAEKALAKARLAENVVVDCSHANSYKRPELQPLVMQDCVNQIRAGNRSIVGLMIESFIEAGNQPIPEDHGQLKYGCSITDACVDWSTTVHMIRDAHAALATLLPARQNDVCNIPA